MFSRAQQRVLGPLFGQPERSYFATELISLAGSGSGAVRREIQKLLRAELERRFGAWLRAKLLRGYVRAARRTLANATSWMVKGGDDELDFMAWADSYIAQLDPLKPAPRNPDLDDSSCIYRPEELDKNAIARHWFGAYGV